MDTRVNCRKGITKRGTLWYRTNREFCFIPEGNILLVQQQTNTQTDRQTDRQTGSQADRQTDRQADTNKQISKQTKQTKQMVNFWARYINDKDEMFIMTRTWNTRKKKICSESCLGLRFFSFSQAFVIRNSSRLSKQSGLSQFVRSDLFSDNKLNRKQLALTCCI